MEGCYPNNDLTISDSDVVLTSYNDEINFNSLTTYYMPDTVLPIFEPGTVTDVDNPYQETMLDAVARNMDSYGYTRVLSPANTADVAVVLSVMTSTTVSSGWYYPYYGWGYWGWYYPYYPPTTYYVSYTTGTVVIEMFDPENYTIEGSDTIVKRYWTVAMNGILESSTTDMKNRIESSINQAFIQTPQIKTN
jgi:hypothetical protein